MKRKVYAETLLGLAMIQILHKSWLQINLSPSLTKTKNRMSKSQMLTSLMTSRALIVVLLKVRRSQMALVTHFIIIK